VREGSSIGEKERENKREDAPSLLSPRPKRRRKKGRAARKEGKKKRERALLPTIPTEGEGGKEKGAKKEEPFYIYV